MRWPGYAPGHRVKCHRSGRAPVRLVPTDTTTGWGRTFAPDPYARLRLICFPYAGAGASIYRDWQLRPQLSTEVWSVQLPGRENRRQEPPVRRLDELLPQLHAGIAGLLDRPFAFFGHSMGALIAFELTRFLRRLGGPQPVHLFLSGHRSPERPPTRGVVSSLPDDAFLARLSEMAGSSPSALRDQELLLLLAPITRADFELCEQYAFRPEPSLDIDISCFGAVDDSEVELADVACWEAHTTRRFRLRSCAGGHLFLRDQRTEMLDQITGDLAISSASRAFG
ncbi:thioesterase II family protein [Micromonospora lupini]|uniref:thioesterase II family protein n=1 Tax=Micromonospora lupini TaxID=285679 RepID=UPI0034015384